MNQGYEVIIIDDLSNSKDVVLDKIESITGKLSKFYKMNILNEEDLEIVFKENKIDAVIHFAAFKAVGESVSMPIEYYYNNLTTTLVMLKLMKKYSVKNFVFSSSAIVYSNAKIIPITQESPLSTTNPYGATKFMIEDILRDVYKADKDMNIAIGELKVLSVFGNDYNTVDGTGVRDYIHVVDLAKGYI